MLDRSAFGLINISLLESGYKSLGRFIVKKKIEARKKLTTEDLLVFQAQLKEDEKDE